ncbi:MAG: 3-isopropylmalate dehydratase small subunit [Actinomycetes bacterium]
MEPFTRYTGTALPLRRRSVDTDQIIDADWVKKSITRSGFGPGLFSQWRAEPSFIMNDPRYAKASILLTGPNFGIGSSREHAVWAIMEHGFRAVISESFADIFHGNALNNGLLPICLDAGSVEALIAGAEDDPTMPITCDLVDLRVVGGPVNESFEISDHDRWRLLNGLDDIAITLTHESDVAKYESDRLTWLPAVN